MTLDHESGGGLRARTEADRRGETIAIVIRGRSRDLLRENLVDGHLIDFGAITRSRALRLMVALVRAHSELS